MPSSEHAPEGITFDLDDTLWCGKETLQKATRAFHDHLERSYPLITQSLFQSTWTNVLSSTDLRDFTALRQATLKQCAESVNYNADDVVSTSMRAFLAARSSPTLFDGVEVLLQRLQVGMPLALKVEN
ncbi:hypothetical protein DYB28_013689 [Aphanomyces astaci]|uniref:Uncharacterized protein n=1 Tax=Aphanomyces astaci TaxID=112090 RepID=A0A9X8HG30_APHAT|nr:hypothetical protein DYB28_013689 [Aphanomyces astaci]